MFALSLHLQKDNTSVSMDDTRKNMQVAVIDANDAIKEIVSGCIRNERVYQQKLYKLYAGKLLGICFRYTKNKMEAEDLCQDAFVKIFNKLGSFNWDGSFEGWLKRITVNTVLEYFRKQKLQYQNIDETFDNTEQNAYNIFERMGNYDAALMMQQLPPATRIVFNLHTIEGYKHSEIAEQLNISEGTSKWHCANARKLLQALAKNQKF